MSPQPLNVLDLPLARTSTPARLVGIGEVPEGARVVALLIVEDQIPATSPVASAATSPGVPLTGAALTGAPVTGAALTGAALTGVPVTAAETPAAPHLPAVEGEVLRPGLRIDRDGRRVLLQHEEVPLTRREYDLFEHLAAHAGQVRTRNQLLVAVWGHDQPTYVSARTVDVHVARLRRKLGPRHGDALTTLRGVGYRWSPAAPTTLR